MDGAMIQLRLFVHQRLYAAAEEILGEVERTVALASCEAKVGRREEEVGGLRNLLELRNEAAAEPSLTSGSTVERGGECEAPLPQEIPGPSTPEEPDFKLSAEVLGPNQTNTNDQMLDIKEEQRDLGDDGRTQEMFFPPPENVKSEQDQPETQVSYEMQPVSSDDSAAQSESDDSDGELVASEAERIKTLKWKRKTLKVQSGNVNETDRAVLPGGRSSAKSDKDRSFCYLCGKGFQYLGSLMNHIKTHGNNFDRTVCENTSQSTKEPGAHLKSSHTKTNICDVCGKAFANIRCLRLHKRTHKDTKKFTCQECGKTFSQRGHLNVHVRTHSGEKPYDCDVCGKAFSQSQNLTIHKRCHSGEKPYQCGLCGKRYTTSSTVKVHMRHHTGEKPYLCDICGKRFSQRTNMTIHRSTHTAEMPYGCHVCGMRYSFALDLKEHLKTHGEAATE